MMVRRLETEGMHGNAMIWAVTLLPMLLRTQSVATHVEEHRATHTPAAQHVVGGEDDTGDSWAGVVGELS